MFFLDALFQGAFAFCQWADPFIQWAGSIILCFLEGAFFAAFLVVICVAAPIQGALVALLPIFAVRLAVPYSAGTIAHFSGVCGGMSDILVNSEFTGVVGVTTIIFFLFACLSSFCVAWFIRSRPTTLHGILARASTALVLAGAILTFELVFTPSLEFLSNFWALQRFSVKITPHFILSPPSQGPPDEVLWAVFRSIFYPSTLVTRSWSLIHASCFSVFTKASQLANAIFLLCFLAGLCKWEKERGRRGPAKVEGGRRVMMLRNKVHD